MKPLPWLLIASLLPGLSLAQEIEILEPIAADGTVTIDYPADLPPIEMLAPITVIGSPEDIVELPGSGYVVESEDIRTAAQPNINQILRKVPGVYVREEDGYGNFPNISLRGGSTTRSEKTTLMEDGVLTAPAPYSSPGAYYSPKAGRMSGIEVLKGSSQVRYGPHTTGGVVNYLSTPLPLGTEFYSRNTYGTFNTVLSHTYAGDVFETERGTISVLAEFFYNRSDGFREIRPGTGFGGSDDTGFEIFEPMFKFSWEPNSAVPQRFEGKYGYSNFDADESYLGLSERDIRATPHDRYPATRFDYIQSEHHRSYLKHIIEPTDNLRFETAGYYNHFHRNWYKVHDLRNVRGIPGNHISLSAALLDPAGLSVLRGSGAGDLRIRANNREYRSYGVQTQVDYYLETGPLTHELAAGVRLHHDEEFRFQRNDIARQDRTGRITSFTRGTNGDAGNRIQETDAVAVWVEDSISAGRLTLRPGARFEHIEQSLNDFATRETGSNDIDVFLPGIGFTFDLTDSDSFFGGIYKGFSVPGPRDAIREGIEEEESIGYELGYRRRGSVISGELAGFFTDYENLIGSQTGGGGDTLNANAGRAEVFGIEGILDIDPLSHREGLALPIYLSGTWTEATQLTALDSGGESIFRGGAPGADLPYIPDWKLAAGIGLETEKWGIHVDGSYVSSSFGTSKNLRSPRSTAREGIIDAAFLLDISSHYNICENLTLIGGVQNLLDREYISSRLAEGPRSGAPRQFFVGFEIEF